MKILITGTAGFIGFHLAERLIAEGHDVVGLDNINDYYDVNLKYGRLAESGIYQKDIKDNVFAYSEKYKNYKFIKMNLEDRYNIEKFFIDEKFEKVCNLAAQAGVRYSIENPHTYIDSNIVGFLNILECCRHNKIQHLVYASSSSVYGLNESQPFSTKDNVDHPISLYAASKKANELMAHTYSHLYDLPTTGLRFFTVYGPWGRPDMAPILFTDAITNDRAINVFNYGKMHRDFTYIGDIVEGLFRVINKPPGKNTDWKAEDASPDSSKGPYRIYNIGNNSPVKLMDFIECIENSLNKKAEKKMLPIQPGDVVSTFADVSDLISDFSYKPETILQDGIDLFINWYKVFYKII